jgi:hypothetical protein
MLYRFSGPIYEYNEHVKGSCIYLPDQNIDIILGATIVGNREDAGAHGYLVVCLYESRAEQVVAPCCLIRIALQYSAAIQKSVLSSIQYQQTIPKDRYVDLDKGAENNYHGD